MLYEYTQLKVQPIYSACSFNTVQLSETTEVAAAYWHQYLSGVMSNTGLHCRLYLELLDALLQITTNTSSFSDHARRERLVNGKWRIPEPYVTSVANRAPTQASRNFAALIERGSLSNEITTIKPTY